MVRELIISRFESSRRGFLQPVGNLAVEHASLHAREGLIGHIADQIVLERILLGSRKAGTAFQPEQVPLLKGVQRRAEFRPASDTRQTARPNRLSENRRQLQHAFLFWT